MDHGPFSRAKAMIDAERNDWKYEWRQRSDMSIDKRRVMGGQRENRESKLPVCSFGHE